MRKKKFRQITVVGGGSDVDSETLSLASEVGIMIADLGAILICGGYGGVMEAVARGAKLHGGVTIGILPGYIHEDSNDFIDITIPTGLGHARNVLVVSSGDIVVALSGSHGTRAEISIALILGRPVFGMRAWQEIPGVCSVASPAELKYKLLPII